MSHILKNIVLEKAMLSTNTINIGGKENGNNEIKLGKYGKAFDYVFEE
ncbi:MAG: hypothetical protein V1910_03155 [bacterium]